MPITSLLTAHQNKLGPAYRQPEQQDALIISFSKHTENLKTITNSFQFPERLLGFFPLDLVVILTGLSPDCMPRPQEPENGSGIP